MSSSLKTTTPNSTEEATRRYDSCSDSDIEENIFATCYKEKRDVALASALKNLNSTKKRKAVKENITEIERCNENIKEKRNLHQKNGNSLSEDSQELDISFDLSNVKLSRSQQKRLKKDNKKAEMAADELFKQFSKLEAEAMQTTYIIDDDIIIDSDEEDLSALLTLFIRWESKLFRWTMRQFQKFATVYQEVAERFSVNVAQVLLCYNDKVIHPDSCPKDLKLSVGGIIEGGIQSKPELYKNLASTSTIRPHSPDAIPLKVQNADRKGTVTVYIKKQDKMIELMHRYVEAKNLELAKLRFSFDGTPLDPRDTPETLDLEGDECIDVYMI
ncbi:hypothetical protein SK128_004942 [Halocaridina rubra]|uniref:Ubiquitin-like domain-containing protein n=1 Tax=Halocaridina rubra TaxID=373956 RepID=A0AAN8XB57_HALRR